MNSELIKQLKSLKLHYIAENMEVFIQEVSGKETIELLKHLSVVELEDQQKRSLMRRLTYSQIDTKKLKFMCDFDWAWPKKISREAVESVFTLDFIKDSVNIILTGLEGLGKTMIAKNIAYKAVTSGYKVLYTTTAKMLGDLGCQDSVRLLNLAIKRYTTPDILILDEFGYISYAPKAADLLFEIINCRYEKLPVILTTNVAFVNWGTLFPGATCVRAILDRLIHKSEIIQIEGESYRYKEAAERKNNNNGKDIKNGAKKKSNN